MRKLNKKGYFFLIDAIFALVILMIGFMIITSSKPTKIEEVPLSLVSENVVDLISTVKIDEICDGCDCSILDVQQHCSNIKNMDQTLLDYIGELYFFYEQGNAAEKNQIRAQIIDVFSGITEDLYRQELYGIELFINNEEDSFYLDGNSAETQYLITSKRIVFGQYENRENGDVAFWGPYLIEINIWEK